MEQAGAVWHHPANCGRRPLAFVRWATFHVRGRVLHRRTLTPIGDHSVIWADLGVVSTIRVVVGNPPDWAEMRAWRRLLRPGDIFVDVGASAGLYTLWAADLGADVIAVEPDPTARALLEKNLSLNRYSVEVVPAALAALPGRMAFTTTRGTMNHLVPGRREGTPLDDPRRPTTHVGVRTLDEILAGRSARGVKIDVEGAERLVLDGATVALAQGRLPFIQLEWNRLSLRTLGEGRGPVTKQLVGYGYQFFRPDPDGRLHPTDAGQFGPDMFAVLGDQPFLKLAQVASL